MLVKKSILVSLIALFLTGCTTLPTPSDEFKGQTAQQIFEDGDRMLANKSYHDAIKQFEALDALYPFASYEEQAQLNLIYAYYQTEDFVSSATTAQRFIRMYPRSEHVDYAYFMKGMAHYEVNRGFASKYFNLDLAQRDLSNAEQAFKDFGDLIRYYPTSAFVPNAQARMINLRNLLARHEVEVATYYYNKNAYLAAANRANYVVEHYQTTPSVIPALGIMIDSYRNLGMDNLADQTLAILKYNYPDSDVCKRFLVVKK
jgi:outer membrane protein assembly factor BamD